MLTLFSLEGWRESREVKPKKAQVEWSELNFKDCSASHHARIVVLNSVSDYLNKLYYSILQNFQDSQN